MEGHLRIGAFAAMAGLSADVVRYYERLGLLETPSRSDGGYRLYDSISLRRLQFIRRAKLLGLSLVEIRGLLAVAEQGDCRPLRQEVIGLLRQKIDQCAARVSELQSLQASLEARYQSARDHENEASCCCAGFPAGCPCLPVRADEVGDGGPDPTFSVRPRRRR